MRKTFAAGTAARVIHSLPLLLILLLFFPLDTSAFVDRGEVVSRTLSSGLSVHVREDPAQKVAELQIWVGVGSRDEPAGKEGIAHLFEHMLFKGTGKLKVGEIAGTVEALGGEINAWTSVETTVYHITVSSAYLGTALAILADAVQHASFDPAELEKEKQVVVEEIHQGKDQPVRVFSERLFRAAYVVHPYGRTVIGTEESVRSVTRDDMVEFFRAWYVPRNMRLVAAGGVKAEDVFRRAEALFEQREGRPLRREASEPAITRARILRMAVPTDPARVTLAFPIVRLTDPETPVLDLLAAVLSQGDSSRLPLRLRDRGVVLSAWAGAYTPADPGLFMTGATAEQGRVREALSGLLGELADLQREGPAGEELTRARSLLLADRIFSRESVEGQARQIGSSALATGDPLWEERYYSRLQAVDASDLVAAARAFFRPERAVVGFLTREELSQPSDEEVRASLGKALGAFPAPSLASSAGSVTVDRLGNGITLLMREDHRLPLVAIRAGVPGGSRYEDERTQGSFNLMARLLTRGTEHLTARDLAVRLDSLSASLEGFSGRNSYGVTGKFLSRDLAEALDLAREVLTRPAFPEEELVRTASQVASEIRAKKDRLSSVALETFLATLFTIHPYRFPVNGTEESVLSLRREALAALHGRALRPRDMVISVCGDVDGSRVRELASRAFGDLAEGGDRPAPPPPEPPARGVRRTRVAREGKAQTHIVLGFPGPTFLSPDREAVEVLNAVLAGQGGRLFAELRDNRSLAYAVWSIAAPGVEPGFFAFSIATSPEKEQEAVEGLREQIRRVRETAVTDEELARAKNYLAGSHEIGLQTVEAKAEEAFFPVLYGEDLAKALIYRERILSVTADQVREAARRYLSPDDYALAVVAGGRH